MPPTKRVRRTANAADEPAGPPASAADAPTPAASSAASPPAPSTGEDTGSKEGKKESVAHWSPIELAVRALPPLCVVQYCTADTVLLICLSVHRPPLVRGSTRASGGVRVPRLTASTRRPSRTRTSSRRSAAHEARREAQAGGPTAKAQEVAPPSRAPLGAGAGSSCLILSEPRPHLCRFIATFE